MPDAASMARPCGLLNDTAPSAETFPDDEMTMIGVLSVRAAYTTKSAPPASICTVTNCGRFTPAANVVTTRERVSMTRMRSLAMSATKTAEPPTATLFSAQNVAAVPTPLDAPDAVPPAPPASVVTAFVKRETARTRLLPLSAI